MRPVNLLPARYRPRTAGSGDSKTSYLALGALGLVVLAVFAYVMTSNSVSSKNSEIAQARQQIAAAEARAVTFEDFGNFAAVKERRLAAVQTLATARLDWERLFRELAHVLPNGVWLTSFSGKAPGASSDAGAGSDEDGNAVTLQGCAASHRQIADVMVRLRELHIAEDVELAKTMASEEEDGAAAPPVAPGAAVPADAAGGGEGCGSRYTFDIAITMASPAPAGAGETTEPVPARLGGGS